MPLDQTHSVCCTIEAAFPLHGAHLPRHHGTALYAALCEQPDCGTWLAAADHVAIAPITGRPDADGLLALTPESRLLLRLPPAELPQVLRLAGRRLELAADGARHLLDIGEPRVRLPQPAAELRADLVVFDDVPPAAGAAQSGAPCTAEAFAAAMRRALAALEIAAEPVPGPAGSLALPGRTVPGFGLHIAGLSADNSIHLQEAGLGDHHKLGCGVFVPG
ncbi:type I-MYXAN CRISPR-associated protein Cas6/Cmx6 [uncultured Thiohalocapsa sp.]|uniref:type I-MYXAN CRISPR-associated protein Cas6/Cmx6 n=1 Tax=uncultured Thiohalocapsa sp. TaxID=768990 RepID=UPI0025ED60A8|nr:type I-MYXAN CRISPR-associated protein Cas6/Cmx6 [uncultured Thiohalocapsa sp.]